MIQSTFLNLIILNTWLLKEMDYMLVFCIFLTFLDFNREKKYLRDRTFAQ